MENKIKICGKYIIRGIEEFGSGSFGHVYLARKKGETKEGKEKLYVIKFPEENPIKEKFAKKSFVEEINILKELTEIKGNTFTSILYDFKKFNGEKSDEKEIEEKKFFEECKNVEIINSPYYVIDYFSKGILYDYIYSGKITERLAKVIFKKIIESFQFLHSKCICHLDIKPNNIIFDNYFWPVIIDFGHAQKFDDKDGKLVEPKGGAERFKAPEVRKKKKLMVKKLIYLV